MAGKSPFLFLSPLSLSLSLSIRFPFFPPPVSFPSFFLLFFFLPYLPNFPLFVCSHPISFSFPFYLFSHFLISFFFSSFFSFLFSFLFLIWIASTKWSKGGGNFPPLSSIATCHHHHFSLNFLIFLFPLFPSFDTSLNLSHLSQFATPHGSCHVSLP